MDNFRSNIGERYLTNMENNKDNKGKYLTINIYRHRRCLP